MFPKKHIEMLHLYCSSNYCYSDTVVGLSHILLMKYHQYEF
uniref:Uncharacterized protein n=1 Tax=Arundo donax TaxID=35708 RepID=A0A0A9GXE6_ARUDO